MIKAIYLGKTALLAMAALGASAPAWAGTSDSVRQAVSPDALDALGAVPSSKDKQAFAAVFAAIDGHTNSGAGGTAFHHRHLWRDGTARLQPE